jgi:hypothetical protein
VTAKKVVKTARYPREAKLNPDPSFLFYVRFVLLLLVVGALVDVFRSQLFYGDDVRKWIVSAKAHYHRVVQESSINFQGPTFRFEGAFRMKMDRDDEVTPVWMLM